jgi:hypothetical protein
MRSKVLKRYRVSQPLHRGSLYVVASNLEEVLNYFMATLEGVHDTQILSSSSHGTWASYKISPALPPGTFKDLPTQRTVGIEHFEIEYQDTIIVVIPET